MRFCNVGPLPKTVPDFWRMIWELKLPTIIMLTGVTENGMVNNELILSFYNSNFVV